VNPKIVKTRENVDEQLVEIYEHYFNVSKDVDVAQNVINKLLAMIDNLSEKYKYGINLSHRVGHETNLKFVTQYNYAIIYDILETEIDVISIVHMSRNLQYIKF